MTLQFYEALTTFIVPDKWYALPGESGQWSSNLSKSVDELPTVSYQAKETTYLGHIGGQIPVNYCFNLGRIHENSFTRNYTTEKGNLIQLEGAFAKFNI